MKIPCTLFLTAVLVIALSFSSCQEKKKTETPANAETIARLGIWGDSLISRILVDSVNRSVQGAIFYVKDPAKGLEYTKAFGTSDVSTTRYKYLQFSDLFRIGTFTNTLTETVFLQLVEENVLQLDEPLSKYVPEVPGSDTITLRQVANMTSGLYDLTETDSLRNIWSDHPLRVLTPLQLLGFATAYPPYFGPGAGCRYSSTNSLVMGMIIERVTNHTLSEMYRARIYEPLELSDVTFPDNQFMPFYTAFTHGYEYSGSQPVLNDVTERYDPSWAWGSANLISDLSDVRVLLESLVNGDLLSADLQQQRMQMTDWENVHGIPMQYGLGIMGTSGYYGHTGDVQGFHCIGMMNPATGQTIIVIMNNGSGSPLLMFAQIANLLNPGLIPLSIK